MDIKESSIGDKTSNLRVIYGVSEHNFKGGLPENPNPEIAAQNVYNLLSHPVVSNLLLTAKDSGAFSRKDTTYPIKRFSEAIAEISYEIARCFSQPQDFSQINPFTQMWTNTQGYIRGKDATRSSKDILKRATEVFQEYKRDLQKLGLTPWVNGSVRYGDAGPASDLDLRYLSTADMSKVSKREQIRLVDMIDSSLDDRLGENTQNDDLAVTIIILIRC